MTESLLLTAPVFLPSNGVLFSAYGVEWGYRSYLLTSAAACDKLGANNPGKEQVMLAFQLNRQRIARAISAIPPSADGARVVLDSLNFSQS